jgi:hypothetical protein
MLNKEFTAKLLKSPNKGGWNYLVWPESASFFKTRALVKVSGTMDGVPFSSAFMAMGEGKHKLPVKMETLKKLGKKEGDQVHVVLKERYDA